MEKSDLKDLSEKLQKFKTIFSKDLTLVEKNAIIKSILAIEFVMENIQSEVS